MASSIFRWRVAGGGDSRRRETVHFSREEPVFFSLPRSTHLVYLSPFVSRHEFVERSSCPVAFGRFWPTSPAKLIETHARTHAHACTCSGDDRTKRSNSVRVTAVFFSLQIARTNREVAKENEKRGTHENRVAF